MTVADAPPAVAAAVAGAVAARSAEACQGIPAEWGPVSVAAADRAVKPPVEYVGNIGRHLCREGPNVLWARNLLFLGVVGGGLSALVVNLLPPRKPAPIAHYDTKAYQESGFESVVGEVDTAFRQEWQSEGLKPASPAPDLVQARRLSLALMGTVPSLEEVRQLEALPPGQRRQPLRGLLRGAPGTRLRRDRRRAVHLLPPPPVRRLAERAGGRQPAV
jgi:hypothetical protein